MAMAGLDIAGPPQALVDWLKPLGIAAGEGKLVDLTLAGAKPEIVAGTIERLLADDGNDAAIFVVGSSAQFNPELAVEPLLKFAKSAKPFAVSLTPSAEKSLALLTAAGVPAFRHPESCAEAMALCLLRPVAAAGAGARPAARAALDALAAGRASGFDERRAADLFAALGVPMAKAMAVPDAKRIAAAVAEIGGPVALKILSADIAHKTEAGGVALGLPDGQTAAVAAREIEKRVKAHMPNAKLEGFLVQKMERGLAEVILGFRRDPLVGPTITVGLGGVLAEIYKDAATRLAPVDESRGAADDRGGQGPGHDPRLSQPAARRCRCARQDDRGVLGLGAQGLRRCRGSRDQSAAGQGGRPGRRRRRRAGDPWLSGEGADERQCRECREPACRP